jgi:aminoglycoside phosphotransferase (APT) family kinase protein
MDSLPLLLMLGSAVIGALVGAAACFWPLNRSIAALRARLGRSEQARNGAVEPSAQAREQIAQLNRAIADLRRTHTTHAAPASEGSAPRDLAAARERIEKALAAGDEETLVLPRRENAQAFADTQVMGNSVL